MPHHSSSLIAAVLLGVVGYSVATEPLVAGAAGQRAPQLVQVDPHEVTALDLEQICEHYPWLTHCQGEQQVSGASRGLLKTHLDSLACFF